ncbi:hypothetical protein AMTRI_Chr01g103600 [Amborella trichopoda]
MQGVMPLKRVLPANNPLVPNTRTRRLLQLKSKTSSLSVSADSHSQSLTTPEAQDALKRALARRAVGLVKSGMVIGLGTGSTASLAIEELGKIIAQGKLKDVTAVGANYQSRVLARQFGVKTVDLNDVNYIDIAFDGADEVDVNKNILKGGGAAHTLQKVVDSMANECVILVDQSKVVLQLGSTFPVAVEVLPPAITPVLRRLISLGGVPEIRSALRKDGPVITDLGNMVLDVSFPGGIQNPAELEKSINMIPGVVENGIVVGVATSVLVAIQDGDDATVVDLIEFRKVLDSQMHGNSPPV